MARVSVIIPAYNASAYIAEALDSLLRQTYSDWEGIVIDDGSVDTTRAVVESFMPAFEGRLRYIYQPNRGLPAARNTGIRNASSEFIALLDSDDIWEDIRLDLGVNVMDSDPRVGLVHAKVARINAAGDIIEYPPVPHKRYLSGRIARHLYTRLAHILCPTVLFRRECLATVGLFDETMRATEDRDLWFRIAERYPIAYIDHVLARYRISPTSMSADRERMRVWQLYFIQKHQRSRCCGRFAALQALSNLHRERGDASFHDGALGEALQSYFKAFFHNPLSVNNAYMLLRALGEPILAKLRVSTPRPGV
jgi:glycosyltransferase involved in cell wall biosynthesis